MAGDATTDETRRGRILVEGEEVDLGADDVEIDLTAAERGEAPVRWVAAEDHVDAAPEVDEADDARSTTLVPVPRSGSGTFATGWRTAAIIGLLIAAVLVAANVLLWGKIQGVEDDLSRTRARLVSARAATTQAAPLEETVADLEASVESLEAAAGESGASVAGEVALVRARLDQVVGCVNTYMDVIGRWSRNVDTTFVYTPC